VAILLHGPREPGKEATVYLHEPRDAANTDLQRELPTKGSIFATDPATCPKCLGPIEPERLPSARLCLDCNVVR
jgi:hypothetical protein